MWYNNNVPEEPGITNKKENNIMDIKAKLDEMVSKVQSDPSIAEEFKTNPVGAVEKVLGVDLPDDIINNIIEGVKAKVNFDNITGMLGGLFGGQK